MNERRWDEQLLELPKKTGEDIKVEAQKLTH